MGDLDLNLERCRPSALSSAASSCEWSEPDSEPPGFDRFMAAFRQDAAVQARGAGYGSLAAVIEAKCYGDIARELDQLSRRSRVSWLKQLYHGFPNGDEFATLLDESLMPLHRVVMENAISARTLISANFGSLDVLALRTYCHDIVKRAEATGLRHHLAHWWDFASNLTDPFACHLANHGDVMLQNSQEREGQVRFRRLVRAAVAQVMFRNSPGHVGAVEEFSAVTQTLMSSRR